MGEFRSFYRDLSRDPIRQYLEADGRHVFVSLFIFPGEAPPRGGREGQQP